MAHIYVLSPPLRTLSPPVGYRAPPPPASPSSDTSFPILAISILGILTTAILLVSYYVFVIKCCLNWRRSDVISRLASSRSRRRRWREDDLFTVYATTTESHGLAESVIRAIPTFRFNKAGGGGGENTGFLHECAVCLNEFDDGERLRRLPGCSHAFHIDCIDTWLQSNANCPLCRTDITAATVCAIPTDEVFVQGAHHEPLQCGGSVVIEVRDGGCGGEASTPQRPALPPLQCQPPPSKVELWRFAHKKGRKLHHVSSMGDECIDVRGAGKDEGFAVQPIRRSFSMNSCDRQLYLSVQEILQQNPHFYSQEIASGEGCSGGGGSRVRRSFFTFGRSSRSAVLPVTVQP